MPLETKSLGKSYHNHQTIFRGISPRMAFNGQPVPMP